MKPLKFALLSTLCLGVLAAPLAAFADDPAKDAPKDAAKDAAKKPKPYILKTCPVSGDKLGGDMGEPFVFVYKDKKIKDDVGREIKLCCKSCKKDFDKDAAKLIKKIEKDEAKLAAK